MPAGRPLKFKTAKELQKKIDAYFKECDRNEDTRIWKHGETAIEGKNEICMDCENNIKDRFGRPSRGCKLVSGELKLPIDYTITGLALALDTSRQTLVEYEAKDEFIDAIKKAKLRVENSYEHSLREKGRSGDIFALKNFNWKDKSEQDITSDGEKIEGVTIEYIQTKQNEN
jgi:hypothetical protein